MQIVLFCFATGICTLSFLVKKNFPDYFYSPKYVIFLYNLIFKFFTFPQTQQFGELFPKRFATGICDFRGPLPCIA